MHDGGMVWEPMGRRAEEERRLVRAIIVETSPEPTPPPIIAGAMAWWR